MIIPPQQPDWRTYLALCKKPEKSLSRFLSDSAVTGMTLKGKVLDIGGVPNSPKDWKSFFTGYETWETLNIVSFFAPDYVADCNAELPFSDATFDSVVSMSTLEHIFDIRYAISEMIRILKPGGILCISVPFMFAFHGDPDDFHRPTMSWYEKTLDALNIPEHKQKIFPYCWDAFSTGISLVDNAWPVWRRRLLRPMYLLPGLLFANKQKTIDRRLYTPLGYIVAATK